MTDESPPPLSPASDVFISYASQDVAVANTIVAALETHGIKCWIAPRDVRPGTVYADAIVRAINEAQALVLVLSANAMPSAHVGREVERAASKRKQVIAFRVDATPLSRALEYFLSDSQWIDVPKLGMPAALATLTAAVRQGPATSPQSVSVGHSASQSKRNIIFVAAVAGACLAVGGGVYFWSRNHSSAHTAAVVPSTGAPAKSESGVAASDKSIAVLPFVDMSEKHDQEYFSDGLSEELIDHLAHIPDLKVIARTSSFAFKGKNEDMRTIATKLGVANLLEGSVRKAGGELRITAQLIRASDGVHRWSETYDRRLTDIFKIQDEISTTVAKALNTALNSATATDLRPASNGTTNIAAYNLLLQGNYYYYRGDKGDNGRAVERYEQALKLDPQYALAWAQLARVYAWQGYWGEMVPTEAGSKGREAAARALAIDSKLPEAYYARANVLRLVVGDWAAATSDYERAAALDTNGEVGLRARGDILMVKGAMSGEYGDYIDWLRANMDRNPLDTGALSDLGWYQQLDGNLDASAADFSKLLELNPTFSLAQALYAMTLLLQGKNFDALAMAQKEPDDASRLAALACIYWSLERRQESDSALHELVRRFSDRNQYVIAAAYAYRGEADVTFTWLDRAYQDNRGSLLDLRADPEFRKVHGDPRFEAFLRKVKLVE